MISAAGFFLGLTLAAGPPELRQRFDEALSAEQRGDATACLAKLNEVTRALGRATLRVQPILVRCLTMAGGRDQQVLGEVAAYRRLSPDPALAETIDGNDMLIHYRRWRARHDVADEVAEIARAKLTADDCLPKEEDRR